MNRRRRKSSAAGSVPRLLNLDPVSLAQLQAGDLVIYNTLKTPFSHVGICISAGRFVHAPKSGAQVGLVSIRGACRTPRFDRVRRIEPGS
ncbi:MAG: NlpC/P60 family protein [Betaproteobacteria bacterium]|nr:NlpC/P60 family protein [Betaproteobacteria bacterium]